MHLLELQKQEWLGRDSSIPQLRALREEDLGWKGNPRVGTCASRGVNSDGFVVLLVLPGLIV